MNKHLFYLHALSAVHVGTGQGVGAVDLPIARSRASNLPIIPGSAVKGVLRDALNTDESNKQILFGATANQDNVGATADQYNPHAGAVAFSDAQLLLLPIRSFAGTVAYATCPFILRRYARDSNVKINIPAVIDTAAVANDSILLIGENKIALEDLDMDAQKDNDANQWAENIAQAIYPNDETWQRELKQRVVILPDNEFSFLADTATEIRTRIQIDRTTRMVKEGALWTEENLPCETVLWGIFAVSESRDQKQLKTANELSEYLLAQTELTIQMGGKHTVGRGLCRLLMDKGD